MIESRKKKFRSFKGVFDAFALEKMTSASVQLRLQRQVLDEAGEHLLGLVHCAATSSKGRIVNSFVCLVKDANEIHVAEFRSGSGNNDELPKKKRSWPLEELSGIDAKSKDGEKGAFFALDFGVNVFAFSAVDAEERDKFLSTLINLGSRIKVNYDAPCINILMLPVL